jgi:hypothetical protein
MPKRVLILSQPRDIHAYAVREALERKGASVTLWLTSDFPGLSRESIRFRRDSRSLRVRGPDLEIDGPHFDAVWNRRPSLFVDPASLDEADVAFAGFECSYFRKGLFSTLCRDAFWVNPPDSAFLANRKILQHAAALKVGLVAPDTLYSNDPEQIRLFIREHGGSIVYKPFTSVPWRDEKTYWLPLTSVLTEDKLPGDTALSAAPGIYQELVPKKMELRLTIMGGSVFGARILSQQTKKGRIDWRKAYDELVMEDCEVPESLASDCVKLLSELGLVFGCFDFIVTPAGEYVFLEVNEMGQFLFIEPRTGSPLLDAFSEFLLAGRREFTWEKPSSPVLYSEVSEAATRRADASAERHVCPPNSFFWESSREG